MIHKSQSTSERKILESLYINLDVCSIHFQADVMDTAYHVDFTVMHECQNV